MSPCDAHATDDFRQHLSPFFLVVVCDMPNGGKELKRRHKKGGGVPPSIV